MKLASFHPQALAELQAQAQFYEAREPGLGERFAAELQAAPRLAEAMPGVVSPFLHGTRRVFPQHFPCAIVYREMTDHLVVIAIAPFRREPGYWARRA